jgi:hypothetical protein
MQPGYNRLPIHQLMHQPTRQQMLSSQFYSAQNHAKTNRRAINQATQYCRNRSWHFVVQHESVLQTGWCMNVFIRPKQNESINTKSVAAGLTAALVRYAQFSKESFLCS